MVLFSLFIIMIMAGGTCDATAAKLRRRVSMARRKTRTPDEKDLYAEKEHAYCQKNNTQQKHCHVLFRAFDMQI